MFITNTTLLIIPKLKVAPFELNVGAVCRTCEQKQACRRELACVSIRTVKWRNACAEVGWMGGLSVMWPWTESTTNVCWYSAEAIVQRCLVWLLSSRSGLCSTQGGCAHPSGIVWYCELVKEAQPWQQTKGQHTHTPFRVKICTMSTNLCAFQRVDLNCGRIVWGAKRRN